MDIIRGSLDGISRPASAPQHFGGRSNVSQSWHGTLEVLSPELKIDWDHEVQLEDSSDEDENHINNVVSDLEAKKLESSAGVARTCEGNFPAWREESEDERQILLEHSEIWNSEGHAQDIMHINMEITKALEKMQSLDAILEKKREREEMVKSESKKQWKMREDKQVQRNISASEMEEDFLDISFLMECHQGIIEEGSLIKPVFCTQVPVCDTSSFGSKEQDEPGSTLSSPMTEKIDTSCIGDDFHGKRQRDELRMKKRLFGKTNFITKNIEAARNPVTLTDDEKRRLNELLEGIDDMEGKASDNNVKSLPSPTPGVGFTLEIWEQQRLADIDNYLQAFQSEMLHHKIESTARETHVGQAMSNYWRRNATHGGKMHHWWSYPERLGTVDQRLTELQKACSRNGICVSAPLKALSHLDDLASVCRLMKNLSKTLAHVEYVMDVPSDVHIQQDSRLSKEQLEDLLWECTSRKGDACQTGHTVRLPEYALIRLLEDAGASSSASDNPEGDLQDMVTFDQSSSYYMRQVLEGSKISRLVTIGTEKSVIDIGSDDQSHNYNNSDLCNFQVPNVESIRRPAFLDDPEYLRDIDGSNWQTEFSVLGNDDENEDCFDEY